MAIFKKDDPFDKSNCRSISILSLISKVYESLIYDQLSDYTGSFIRQILCSFRRHRTLNMDYSKYFSVRKES